MLHSMGIKCVRLTPQTVTAAGTATQVIDRLGYDYCTVFFFDNTASTAPSVLKISESDTTDATNYSDITAFTGGTSAGNFTIPTADTTNGTIVQLNIDCKARKRYLKLSTTAAVSTVLAALAILSRAKETPINVTQRGINTLVAG